MSAAEEDTELRDLLIQNLENSGVLNKIKAELRAAVFLALEEQEKVENRTPLVNESLTKFLGTKDGRLVTSLITDFLQVFNLDFTLAVFQPEINTLDGLENRQTVARELAIPEPEGIKGTPLLLELIKRSRHKAPGFAEGDRAVQVPKELSPKQIAEARKQFDLYDKNKKGEMTQEELTGFFADLFPNFNTNMLESYITDELRTLGKDCSSSIHFQEFLAMYRQLFVQCRSVVTKDVFDVSQTPSKFVNEKTGSRLVNSKIPRYKGFIRHGEENEGAKVTEVTHSDASFKGLAQVSPKEAKQSGLGRDEALLCKKGAVLEANEEEEEEGDSFFDDPLPKPDKTYACLSLANKSVSEESLSEKNNSHNEKGLSQREKSVSGGSFSPMRKNCSLNDLSAINSDTDDDAAGPLTVSGNGLGADGRTVEPSKAAAGLSDLPVLNRGRSSPSGATSLQDPLGGNRDEDDYDDDFNSASRQSDKSKSELSIGEEIEDVSIEGPDVSDKLDDLTQDRSVSQLSQVADYMEEVT